MHEWPTALHVELRVADADLGLVELRLRLIERALEWTRVDGEQKIARLDVLAVGELHLGEIAGDARAHLDRLDRGKAAGELVPLDDVAGDGLADGELWRYSFGGRLLRTAAESRERRLDSAADVLKAGLDPASAQWTDRCHGGDGDRYEG